MTTTRPLMALAALTALTACGSLIGQAPGPAGDCHMERLRGVAQLTAIDDGRAHFLFYPGDLSVTTSPRESWSVGSEFKAIIEVPEESGCADRRLVEIVPLTPRQ